MPRGDDNRQTRKTKAALLAAFNALIVKHRYADIRVADIIQRADVGRSTFYEHFRNKDDVLRQSLSGILTVLASACGDDCDLPRLQYVLEHFAENSRSARGLLNGPSSPQVVNVLAAMIAERLAAWGKHARRSPAVPLSLGAAQVAEAQLGLVRAWLNGGASCSADVLASAMHNTASAASRALFD